MINNDYQRFNGINFWVNCSELTGGVDIGTKLSGEGMVMICPDALIVY